MSIFSRLFKGPEDGDKETSPDEGAPDPARPAGARKTAGDANHATHEAKGAMRPMAPAFQIQPPISERSGQGAVAATPVVQVGGPDSKPAAQAQPPRSQAAARPTADAPQISIEPSGVRSKTVGAATMKLGASPATPAPTQGQPASNKPSSGAQRAAPPPPPPHAARPNPAGAASSPRGPSSRSKVAPAASSVDVKGSNAATRAPDLSQEDFGLDGLLTLELGTSPGRTPGGGNSKRSATTTAQGLAPAARAAQTAAARAAYPDVTSAFEHEANLQTDLDAAFGALVEAPTGASQGHGRTAGTAHSDGSISEVRELFASLAANHMRQVREFMIGVKWGEAPRDWIPICEPAVGSLLRAAKEMDLADLCVALDGYRDALGRANQASDATIGEGTRDDLMTAYAKLADLMPQAFGLDGERGRRETIIVHALLQQVPEVRKVTIDKIYAAGLTNLDNLFLARPDEISATTGIGENVASRIVERFQRYKKEIASLADATRAAERKRLGELASELRGLHQDFERAARGWSDDERADKKKFRQARAEALLHVKVLLARLGEVDRLSRIERLPFERKIEQLEAYLGVAKVAAVP